MTVADVIVVDGSWSPDKPVIVFDAATAAKLALEGQLEQVVSDAIRALELGGKKVVVVEEVGA